MAVTRVGHIRTTYLNKTTKRSLTLKYAMTACGVSFDLFTARLKIINERSERRFDSFASTAHSRKGRFEIVRCIYNILMKLT
jgi:hypothetical protein